MKRFSIEKKIPEVLWGVCSLMITLSGCGIMNHDSKSEHSSTTEETTPIEERDPYAFLHTKNFDVIQIHLTATIEKPKSSLPVLGETLDRPKILADFSQLRITIPSSLETIAQLNTETILAISSRLESLPVCRKTDGTPIDVLLAQACIAAYDRYLFLEDLPPNLDSFPTVHDYVGFLKRKSNYNYWMSASDLQSSLIPTLTGTRPLIGIRLHTPLEGTENVPLNESNPFLIDEVILYTRGWLDGLHSGDRILAINEQAVEGLTFQQARSLLPSTESATVQLKLLRDHTILDIQTATEIHISKLLPGKIGYLNFRQFTQSTLAAIQEDLKSLEAQSGGSLQQIILDLRNNSGGLTQTAREVTDYWINQDLPSKTHPMVSIQGREKRPDVYYLGDGTKENAGAFTKANLVVLMNEGSASATEILISALRDYGIATLIGRTSFGKGVQQQVIPLLDASGLVLVTHQIIPPSQQSYHQTGIIPDGCVGEKPSSTPDSDPQLQAARLWLEKGTLTQSASCSATSRQNRHDPFWGKAPLNEVN